MALIISYILKSSHIEHIDCTIIRTCNNLSLRQSQSDIDSSRVILNQYKDTDENEADLAIFFTPEGGIFGKF